MKVVIPREKFSDGFDICDIHGKKVPHSCIFLGIDYTLHKIIFFLFCDECYKKAEDKSTVSGWVIKYPIADWLKNYNVNIQDDN